MLSADKLGNSFNAKRQRIRGNIPKTMSGFLIVLFFVKKLLYKWYFFFCSSHMALLSVFTRVMSPRGGREMAGAQLYAGLT